MALVIPTKTHTQIARKLCDILSGKFPIDVKQRQVVTDSLKVRRWSELDRIMYIRAASGCKASRDNLTQRGLWYNGTGKGGH